MRGDGADIPLPDVGPCPCLQRPDRVRARWPASFPWAPTSDSSCGALERSLVQQGRVLAAALEDSGPRLREKRGERPAAPAPAPRRAAARGGCTGRAARGLREHCPRGRDLPGDRCPVTARPRIPHRVPLRRHPRSAPPRRHSSTGWRPFPSGSGGNTCIRRSRPPNPTSTTAGAKVLGARRSGRLGGEYGAETRVIAGPAVAHPVQRDPRSEPRQDRRAPSWSRSPRSAC